MLEGATVPSEEDIKVVREEMKAEKKKNRRGSRDESCDSRGGRCDSNRNRTNNNNNNNSNSNSNSNWNTNAQYEEFP